MEKRKLRFGMRCGRSHDQSHQEHPSVAVSYFVYELNGDSSQSRMKRKPQRYGHKCPSLLQLVEIGKSGEVLVVERYLNCL